MRRLLTSYNVAFLLLVAQPAAAANWEWGSRVSLNANWNDNPGLVDDDRNPESTFRMVAAYNGEFVRLAPSTELLFEPRVTRDYYPDERFKDLESTDIFLPGRFRYSRQRTGWVLGWNLSRQNVLSDTQTVSEDPGFTSLNADDTVYRASLAPSVSWSISEKDLISLSFSASAIKFDLPDTNRADTISGFGGLSYIRTLTERQRLGFSANYIRFRSDNTNERRKLIDINLAVDEETGELFCEPVNEIRETEIITEATNNSFTLDYSLQITPTSSFSANVGLQTTDSEREETDVNTGEMFPKDFSDDPVCGVQNLPTTNEFSSTTYNLSYNKTGQRAEWALRASRRVSANVAGQPQDRYSLQFFGDLRWTEKLGFGLNLNTWRQQNVGLASLETDIGQTYYFGARLSSRWTLDRKWSVSATYEFALRDRPDNFLQTDAGDFFNAGGTAMSNAVFLGVAYEFKDFQR